MKLLLDIAEYADISLKIEVTGIEWYACISSDLDSLNGIVSSVDDLHNSEIRIPNSCSVIPQDILL